MKQLIRQFAGDERGATAIEYALIASGIAAVIIVITAGIGGTLNSKFAAINTSLK